MLRHYDQLGLLSPERVDEWTGHRAYRPDQLARLNRVVALKELGLTLDQVGQVLAEQISTDELRGMLRLRQAQLETELDRGRLRLDGIAYRLQLIESEDEMVSVECVMKTLPSMRIACVSTEVASQPEIAAVIEPMFARLAESLVRAGACPQTGVAVYDASEEGLTVTAGYLYDGREAEGFEIAVIPGAEAATTMHLGRMSDIGSSWQGLHRWCGENGWAPSAPCREIYVEASPESDQHDWVTELQQPVTRDR
jgi:DNA-binding transcriptional MerR regulator